MTKALKLPIYRRLLAAYALNELAWAVGTLALSVLVYRRTGSALGSTSFFICSQFLPGLVAPILVARLDRRAPRRVLPALYGAEGVLFAVLAWMASRFSLAPVLGLALADGVLAVVARALARTATTTVLAGPDLLQEGNALTNAAFSLCFMLGPAIGGAVVVAGGTVAALLANCALFTAVALLLASTALPAVKPQAPVSGGRLRAGLRHVRRSRPLRTLLSLQAVGMVFFFISVPVEVVYAQHTLHAGAGGYGALLSFWGAGSVVGSLAYARWRRRSARILIAAGAASLGIGFGIMAAAPSIEVAVIGSAIGGVSNGVELVAARTAIQQYTTEQWMALVMSLNEGVAQTAPGLGFLLGGLITTLGGARAAFAVAAAGSLVFTAAAWATLSPSRLPAPVLASDREPPRQSGGSEQPATNRETLV